MAAPSPRSVRQEAAENLASLCSAEEIIPVVESVTTAMAEASYRERDIFDLRLALEEAIVNAVKHGNRSDPDKRVVVRYSVTADRVLVDVEDQGMGFDPAGIPDPTAEENLERSCGRGLLLIRSYVSWLRFNERGNCITLCKYPGSRWSR